MELTLAMPTITEVGQATPAGTWRIETSTNELDTLGPEISKREMADKEGFEPSNELPRYTLSKRAP